MGLRPRLPTTAMAGLNADYQCRDGTNGRDSSGKKLPFVVSRKGRTGATDVDVGALNVHGSSRILRGEAAC